MSLCFVESNEVVGGRGNCTSNAVRAGDAVGSRGGKSRWVD